MVFNVDLFCLFLPLLRGCSEKNVNKAPFPKIKMSNLDNKAYNGISVHACVLMVMDKVISFIYMCIFWSKVIHIRKVAYYKSSNSWDASVYFDFLCRHLTSSCLFSCFSPCFCVVYSYSLLTITRKTAIDRGSRSDRPHYHAYTCWTSPLPLASNAPCRTPHALLR